MLTHSHLCPSSLSGSLALFSSTFTHSTPLSPPASMHSLKLCLIAFHHSQAHSAPSARLHLSRAHAAQKAHQPTATCDDIWRILSSLLLLYVSCHSLIVGVYLLIAGSFSEDCSIMTAHLTSDQDYVLGWKRNQKLQSPSGFSRTGHHYFPCYCRKTVHCWETFIMYGSILY